MKGDGIKVNGNTQNSDLAINQQNLVRKLQKFAKGTRGGGRNKITKGVYQITVTASNYRDGTTYCSSGTEWHYDCVYTRELIRTTEQL